MRGLQKYHKSPPPRNSATAQHQSFCWISAPESFLRGSTVKGSWIHLNYTWVWSGNRIENCHEASPKYFPLLPHLKVSHKHIRSKIPCQIKCKFSSFSWRYSAGMAELRIWSNSGQNEPLIAYLKTCLPKLFLITLIRFEFLRISFWKLPDTYCIYVSCETLPLWGPCACWCFITVTPPPVWLPSLEAVPSLLCPTAGTFKARGFPWVVGRRSVSGWPRKEQGGSWIEVGAWAVAGSRGWGFIPWYRTVSAPGNCFPHPVYASRLRPSTLPTLSEVSKRGWRQGVGDQQRPKYS